jgi:hypothetical protein
MKFMVQTLVAKLSPQDHERFIGSPEHLRRVAHHQNSLNDLVTKRGMVGDSQFALVSVGMGPPAETVTIRSAGGRHLSTDGPFAETREVIAGFDVADFALREDAIEFARNEHARDLDHLMIVDHLMVVRRIEETWWVNAFRSDGSKLFMLSVFADAERGKLARRIQRAGAEYVQQRDIVAHRTIAWSGALLGPGAEARSFQYAGELNREVETPGARERKIMSAFVLVACESIEDAARWAEKLATDEGDAIEIRSTGGFWLISHN